jgi:hypothetical protein
MYSSNEGGTQQLPNGNEIVTSPKPTGTVREFNAVGALVFSHAAFGSKIKKYSACFINNVPPAIPTITLNNSILSSSIATSYQWYLNGQLIAGATSQTYTPTQSGNFVVRTTDANACVYQYANTFIYNSSSNGVIDVNFSEKITIYPNPTTGIVNIKEASLFGKQFSILVIDPIGKIVKTFYNANSIDISSLANGRYFIKLSSPEGSATKQISITK